MVLLYNNNDIKHINESVDLHYPKNFRNQGCLSELTNYFHLVCKLWGKREF